MFVVFLLLLFFAHCTPPELNSLYGDDYALIDQPCGYAVSIGEAEDELQSFLYGFHPRSKAIDRSIIQSRFTIVNPAAKVDGEPVVMHVFNFQDDCGYAIMAGDRRVPSPMCIVDKGHFEEQEDSTGLQTFILSELSGMYQVARILPDSLKYDCLPFSGEEIVTKASPYYPVDTVYDNGQYIVYYNWVQAGDPVGSILPTQWKQGSPFNGNCPLYWDDGAHEYKRSVVGCVPIAVGQIMAYWTVSFQGTIYNSFNWNYMSSILNESSVPHNHVGWAMLKEFLVRLGDPENLNATYGEQTESYSLNAGRTFENFGYSHGGSLQSYRADSVITALHRGPVLGRGNSKEYYYSNGSSSYGDGHAWVFDQCYNRKHPVMIYDSLWNFITGHMLGSTLLHINWGWGGSFDGFFSPFRFDINSSLLNPLDSRPSLSSVATKTIVDSLGVDYYYQFNLEINTGIHP